ncbi:hypothetical protein [Sphingobium sp. LSP13-1-1.1]|uniref:hypothetical protein n=1 Tax=Sphingobium sp. LSP13-1-1.1 TaxID=3135234 RepID=UPI00343124C2
MSYDPFSALTLITGPAILTKACAILQNGATTRYNLAVTQWREFQASFAAAGSAALAVMLAAISALFIEGACDRDMVRPHHRLSTSSARRPASLPQIAQDRRA